MVFELFGARIRNTLHIRALAGMRFKKLLRKIERGEQDFEHAEQLFHEQFDQGGVIEEAESAILDLVKRTREEDLRVLRLEEDTITYMFNTFEEIFRGMQDMQKLGFILNKNQQHFSQTTKARATKTYQEIAQLFRKDADETYAMLLKLARAFRDQYDALQKTSDGKEARARLRDMMGTMTVLFKEFKERRTAKRATREAKKIHKDVKAEEKVMKELEHLLNNITKQFDEKKFLQDLNKLEGLFRDESATISKYLQDTQMYLLLSVRHYFIILEHIVTVRKDIEFLREDGFSKKSLEKISQSEERSLKKESDKSLKVMREMYQLYNKMKKVKGEAQQTQKAA